MILSDHSSAYQANFEVGVIAGRKEQATTYEQGLALRDFMTLHDHDEKARDESSTSTNTNTNTNTNVIRGDQK